MNVIEAMETCTAMRYLKEDPIPQEVLRQLVYAATRASSPGNSQGWEFVIIEDAVAKKEIGAAVYAGMAPLFANLPPASGTEGRMYNGAAYLAENFAKVPAWILGCGRKVYPPNAPSEAFMHSALYPAAQNMVVAARSLGIGTCFTSFQMVAEPVIRKVCKVPNDVHLCVLVAVGYPARDFKPVKRKPVEQVLHWNTF